MILDFSKFLNASGKPASGGIPTSDLIESGIASVVPMSGETEGEAQTVDASSCTGNKKALFIGINYFGTDAELRGCINDVLNLKEFVTTTMGFPEDPDHMKVLADDDKHDGMPTYDAILAGMDWLVEGAQSGDSLFFHYSGHGGVSKDRNDSDEQDGQDETLLPVDYTTHGQIIDDTVHDHLVKHLPHGVRLTAIVDACHSGSVFDLAFTYNIGANDTIVEVDNKKIAMQAALAAAKSLHEGDKASAMKHGLEIGKALFNEWSSNRKGSKSSLKDETNGGAETDVRVSDKDVVADVIQFSGCMDSQTSADASIMGQATGAFSWAFMESIKRHGVGQQTYVELLTNIRQLLAGKYTQVPQMSTGYKMNMNTPFIM